MKGSRRKKSSSIGRRPTDTGWGTFWLLAAAAGLVALLAVAHTWTRVAVLERKYQLARAHSDHDRLSRELEMLSLEAATWESTAKVDAAARGRLEMTKPPPTSVVVVEAEANLTPGRPKNLTPGPFPEREGVTRSRNKIASTSHPFPPREGAGG